MVRGTTTRHELTLPDELADVSFAELYIVYKQEGTVVLEKSMDDITRDGAVLTCDLTPEETALFSSIKTRPTVQVRIVSESGEIADSTPARFYVFAGAREV